MSDEGFLSRWSRRKVDRREGRSTDEVPPMAPRAVPAAGAVATGATTGATGAAATRAAMSAATGAAVTAGAATGAAVTAGAATGAAVTAGAATAVGRAPVWIPGPPAGGADAQPVTAGVGAPGTENPGEPVQGDAPRPAPTPTPTLDDVATLTRDSSYARFVTPDVDPTVRNAALKKLFTDPHFNVMDGLDTYIDDYNKPDPLPKSMLRQMVQAQFLGLFKDDPQDEDTAVRLQPDDAPGRPDPAPGPGEDPGREH